MSVVAAILAAGRGERFGGDKLSWILRGRPVWQWSYDSLRNHPLIDAVGFVSNAEGAAQLSCEAMTPAFIVEGGATRLESSRAALDAMPAGTEVVVIHDAARPFVSDRVIEDVVRAASRSGAAAPALPIVDTVRRRQDDRYEIVERTGLFAMQTPQAIRIDLLRQGFERAGSGLSDDIALVEALGIVPELVDGDQDNIKITTPTDAERARRIAGMRETRTGIGYDVHQFSTDKSRKLVLGGIEFEGAGLDGHSDADALLHAIVDALLGAAALGDIGTHFPPGEPEWKDRDSREFLRRTQDLLAASGWRILNVDATVIAESPKIMIRAAEIRHAISQDLRIPVDRVSIKATTNERLGFIGRGEGIAAMAIATIAGA